MPVSNAAKKGMTLMEIIVALVIISILAAVSIPNYVTGMEQGAAITAQNNLTAIYNAEKSYYFLNKTWCINSGANPGCAGTTAEINTNLSLNITDSNFNYACATDATDFNCQATNKVAVAFKLNVTNTPIILPGGAGLLNPSCAYGAHPNYCPS